MQRDLRDALAAAQAYRHDRAQHLRLLAAGVVEFVAGWTLIALAFHVHGEDLGRAVFLTGIILAYLGPVWTWLLASWHAGEGPRAGHS